MKILRGKQAYFKKEIARKEGGLDSSIEALYFLNGLVAGIEGAVNSGGEIEDVAETIAMSLLHYLNGDLLQYYDIMEILLECWLYGEAVNDFLEKIGFDVEHF